MGNCCRRGSSAEWDGEEWGSPLQQTSNGFYHKGKRESAAPEKESLLGNDPKNGTNTTEVRIKVTRKELEELLGEIDLQGMSVEQVLEQLAHTSDEHDHHEHHRHWKPALQSIPEDN